MKKAYWLIGLWVGLLFGDDLNLEEIRSASVASSEGVPLGIVNGVSVITGDYTEQASDLEIPGIEPLPLTRSYVSRQEKDHTPGNWCIKLDDSLQEVTDERERLHALVKRPSGASILYDEDSSDGVYFRPHIPKGYTNASLAVGGKTNLKNHSLHRSKHWKRFILTTGDGTEFIYHHQDDPEYYELTEENRASGLSYHHSGSSRRGLHEIRALSKAKKLVGWMREQKTHDKKEHRIIEGSDGSVCHYRFHPFKINQFIHDQRGRRHETHRIWMLTSVSSNRKPSTHYEYTHTEDGKSWLLKKKTLPGGRFLTNEYYTPSKKGFYRSIQGIEKGVFRDKNRNHSDQVLRQMAPVGLDQTPLPIYRFCYWRSPPEEGKRKSKSPCTDVFDALWHKTRYTYSGRDRLLSILKYKGRNPYQLYSKEELKWGQKGTSQEGHLLGKYLLNDRSEILSGQFFRYDKYGNAIEKGVVGCLTGRPCAPIHFTNDRYTQGGEREVTTYVYSKDKINFLESEHHSNGVSIHYLHPQGLDQLHGKITMFRGEVKHREFYSYDKHGALKEILEDDGLFFERDNLVLMTQRKITRFSLQTEFPFGVPKTKKEYYLDLKTGKEKLLKKTCYTYNQMAKVTREEVYDANGAFASAKSFAYDSHGNLLQEVDALGQVTEYRYNDNDEKIFTKGPNGIAHHHSFDQAGRLIEEKQIHPDGQTFVVSHRYNHLNQCIATTDWYGNETLFAYDEFGRCIEISHPPLGNERPVEKREYDRYGNVTCLTQADGHQTKVSYNLYGKPLSIEYPDGSKESFLYQTNGLLEEKTEKNGLKRRYSYDEMKRVVREELWYNGESLGADSYHYNRLHLLSKTDREGHVVYYSYDGAGRLFGTFEGLKTSENHYDALGRLALTIDHEDECFLYTHFTYDLLDRLVEKRVTDAAGNLFHIERKAYDADGNEILQETDGSIIQTRYNGHKQPVWIQDAMGNITHVEYDHNWVNEIGQRVLRILSTDPEGFLNIQIFTPKGLLAQKIRKTPWGEVVLHQTIQYNAMGQAVSVQEELMGTEQCFTVQYRYTPTGAVAFMREGAGTAEQRDTLYSYHPSGKLFEQIKPDGVVLRHQYDGEDRLQELLSSDGSVHLSYRYDRKGRPVLARDEKTGQETIRLFDPLGQLTQETFAHGHTIRQGYDRLGRLSSTEVPGGTIQYRYSGARLSSITKGEFRYEERSHTLAGQPLVVQPFPDYSASYTYNANGRRISIQSAGFSDAFTQWDGSGNPLEREWQGETHRFSYDALYQLVEEPGRLYRSNCFGDRILYGEREAIYSSTRQIQRLGEESFLSDANGNLSERKEARYFYDALDRLVAVETKERRVEYGYDPYHRRISRKEGTSTVFYLYQGQEEIGSMTEEGLQELKILRSLASNLPIGIELQGEMFFPLLDVAGNVAALVDKKGELHSSLRYTAFGEETLLQESALFLPWRYAAKRMDPLTGLIAFGRRDLDSTLGRWITPDPELFENGPNRYTYAKGNPFLFFDRFGLSAETWTAPRYWDFESTCVQDTDRHDVAWNQYTPDEAMFARDTCFGEKTGFYQLKDIAPEMASSLSPLPQGFGMAFVNGICNFFPNFSQSLQYLGNLSGYQIGGVYSASMGFGNDIQKAVYAKMFGICYESMREIHDALNGFFTANPNGVYLLVGHSRGCIDIYNSLVTYHPKLRKQVLVLGVAPAKFIDKTYCMDARHLVSNGDFVYLTDPRGYLRCRNTIQLLEPHPDASWFDHSFESPTYQTPMQAELKNVFLYKKFR